VLPFAGIMLAFQVVIYFWPALVLWLPSHLR
jgi:hypothetical protein